MVFLGIDWGKLIDWKFWIDVNPGELSQRFEYFFLGVLVVSYLLFFISKLIERRLIAKKGFIKAKLWQKFASFALTMAVSFSFIFFCRYEAIPYLGGRFWILIWLLTGLVWLIYLARYYYLTVPAQLKALAERQQKDKYLAKK